MTEREDPLPLHQQHFTAKQIAIHMHDLEGKGVGREYKTHGDIWGVESSTLQVGLLHLILDELRYARKDKKDALMIHRTWLIDWHPRWMKMISKHKREINRIKDLLVVDVNLGTDLETHGINYYGYMFQCSRALHWEKYIQLQSAIERLKSVNEPEDVINLRGIGAKTASKILKLHHDKKKGTE